MIGSLQKRDITLFGLLLAIAMAIGIAGWLVSAEFQDQMLEQSAEDEALHFGTFVLGRLTQPAATFSYGAISEEDQSLLNVVSEAGTVYRYKFYNADGIVVVASRPGDLGGRQTDPFFFDVVRQGETYVEFVRDVEIHPDDLSTSGGHDALDRAARQEHNDPAGHDGRVFVAEVYVPVIRDGAFLGALELYVDASELSEFLSTEIEDARLGAAGMLLLLLVSFSFVIRANVVERNRQLATVQAASQSLALAEEEVLRLNADLEKRVDDRTKELATANDSVTKLNEDLERRVEERTDQISKANDQLYRLNESMTRLNESLEQRVEERTNALNKANSDILRMNEDLERRVEERTSELHAAQSDLLRNERLAALGQLTATVSHELRNPLGAIRTAIYLVAGRTKEKGLGVEGALERADRSITRCDNIITELLDFTRTTDLALESVPFDEWMQSVLDEQTVPKGIAFDNQVSTQGLEMAFDQDRFRRVIINVFNNGCEAMLEEAQSGSDKQHQMTVTSKLDDDNLEIRFADNGPGIPPDILEKIFEPLYSTKSFGVGLGLPTVRQIMRQHGGDIEMLSIPGQGTTVVLTVSRKLGGSADSAPRAAAEPILAQAAAGGAPAEPVMRAAAAAPAEPMAHASAPAEPMAHAAAPAEPVVRSAPEISLEPMRRAEPDMTAEPMARAEPEISAEPTLKAGPGDSAEPMPRAEPGMAAKPTWQATPAAAPAEPMPQVEPDMAAEPTWQAAPAAAPAEPMPQVEPDISADPTWQAAPATPAEPMPQVEPDMAAEPMPQVEPGISAEPMPQVEPGISAEPMPQEAAAAPPADPMPHPADDDPGEPMRQPAPGAPAEAGPDGADAPAGKAEGSGSEDAAA